MSLVPTTSKGVTIAIGVALAIVLWPLVHMTLAWGLGVALIAVGLFIAYIALMRFYRWAIGA